jgi:hypothetical protein
VGPSLQVRGLLTKDGVFEAGSIAVAEALYDEVFPNQPVNPQPLHRPAADPVGGNSAHPARTGTLRPQPGPGVGQQNSFQNETHQMWPSAVGYPAPVVYKFDLLVRTHSFTSSQVLPIDKAGTNAVSFDAAGTPTWPELCGRCRRRRSTASPDSSPGR